MSASPGLDGGCACGFVRYRMLSPPLFVHCCHCRHCQRETGSAFVLNALIENDCVALLSGEVEIVKIPTRSGRGQKIARCPQCRIALWSHYLVGSSRVSFVRVGTLDNPDALPPDIHIYTMSKQPWVLLPPEKPAVSGYYTAAKYWPHESLARLEALRRTKKDADQSVADAAQNGRQSSS